MNRRDFLRAGAILGAGAAAAAVSYVALTPPAVSPSGTVSGSSTAASSLGIASRLADPSVPSEYKDFLRWLQSVSGPYKGTRIEINLQDEPDYRALQNLDLDFFTASGIDSQYDLEPYIINLEKTKLAVETHSPSIDIIDFDAIDIPTFEGNLVPPPVLAETYPELTYPGLEMSDFMQTPMNLVGTYPPVIPGLNTPPGEVFCLPFNTPVMVRYYRTDVYSKLGLDQPATWDDYFAQVQQVGAGTNIYGCVSQASTTTPIFHEFTNHLYSFGGEFWKIDGGTITPTVNSPANVAALENFARFFPYTLPSSVAYTWDDCVDAMAHGLAANAITFEDISEYIYDPLRSIETRNTAFTANPAGPAGAYSTYVGDGLGVSKYSRNPEASWLWLQWATAAGTQMMLLADDLTRYCPSRTSVVNSSFAQEIIATPDYDPVRLSLEILASGKIGHVPNFKTSNVAAGTIAQQIYNAFTGVSTAQAALDAAQAQLQGSAYGF
ncbi:MAG: extracellular solute-binding protein [Nitrososphaerota archaeon]|jgi:multiple sugar transport system substrate-binding protein|nr:extracellular solute-binding protein [Nitrososphaerota archaeon]MDG6979164.1 extracellular solute-binding protein [Nitrososphaerota archaeon]MDG7020539.1 extracellular solute-binding protein [Nitrososphaerota archaeon]MDG7022617.1 extracellular solute-binding protein [Nitrososphaerota archaeon]